MRQKRAKTYRKLMHLYHITFGFRQPYQVIVDSEMCRTAIATRIEFTKQLATVLQGEIKPMITQCSIHELYLQGKDMQPAVDLAKTFERRKCNHREAIPSDECIKSIVGDSNKHRYVIATQSQSLRVHLRGIPGVPIVHMNRSVMIMEPPSERTLEMKKTIEQQALEPSATDKGILPSQPNEVIKHKKRKGPKGPNPLSIKKKARAEPPSIQSRPAEPSTGQKRQREDDNTKDDVQGDGGHQKQKRRRKHSKAVVPFVVTQESQSS